MATIPGTPGDDFLLGTEEDDQITGLAGNDTVFALGGNDTLDGGDGNDDLFGDLGNDTLLAGNDNDTLDGGAGADILTGGAGIDSYFWTVETGNESSSLSQDRVTDFEGAGLVGGDILRLSSFPNRLVFQGAHNGVPTVGTSLGFGNNGFTEVFFALGAASTLLFADSNDNGIFDATDFAVQLDGIHNLVRSDFGTTAFVLRGTEGGDVIDGTNDPDTIFGLGGGDVINGNGGNDIINGGDGNDTLNGDAGIDRISGGNGNDIINGGADRDLLTGNDGNDIINGGAGNDTTMSGGAGNDVVNGGEGNDTLDGDDGNDVLNGGVGDDDFFGGDGNDQIFGEDGNDELFAGPGSDMLNGGAGNDLIMGEGGQDSLTGGAGDDEFEFFTGFNPSSPFATFDTLVDFQGAGVVGGDTLELNNEFFFRGQFNVNPQLGAVLVGGGNGVTDLFYSLRPGNTWLIADENDDGVLDSLDFTLRLQGTHNLTAGDFGRNTILITAGTEGNDVLTGTDGDDRIFGLGGNDQIFGLEGADFLDGGSGDDVIDSGPGFDELLGGAGNDTLIVQEFANASGGDGDDQLFGGDDLFGFQSNLDGDAGNDTLTAGASGAVMEGGVGADVLVGSSVHDFMVGDVFFEPSLGADKFQFGAVWGADTIFDFEDGTDLIDLSTSGFTFANLTVGEQFGEAVITVTGQPNVGSITLTGVPQAAITEADFTFA
ncbi:Bifunctional hemolysin/adenylate cyclase [Pseudomonas fluorescens]|uniref:Bifunctional hemolysin/adenylate cyclase n=1 Tax=Pseudomonas fluorescens TaxID=294 RepID=A0A8H2NUE4_PSEFL|nr:calcium-binding protein [Pseudomonas fluorescens]VVP25155.1 Bifunctional hemolysin/adenylate cyclase [Pseudomonas fluorescens]